MRPSPACAVGEGTGESRATPSPGSFASCCALVDGEAAADVGAEETESVERDERCDVEAEAEAEPRAVCDETATLPAPTPSTAAATAATAAVQRALRDTNMGIILKAKGELECGYVSFTPATRHVRNLHLPSYPVNLLFSTDFSASSHPHANRSVLTLLGVIPLAAALILGGTAAGAAQAASADDGVLRTQSSDQVAPGLTYTHFKTLSGSGWVTGNTLEADLSEPTLQMDVTDSGNTAAVNPVSKQIDGDSSVVAAVNGDFFDMNRTNAPIGIDISKKSGVRALSQSATALTLSSQGIAAIQSLTNTATATLAGKTLHITAVNSPSIATNGVSYFTPVWGSAAINQLYDNNTSVGVLLRDGTVQGIIHGAAALNALLPLQQGTSLLVGAGTGTESLSALRAGDLASVTVGVDKDVQMAVSGIGLVLQNGTPVAGDTTTAARTAVGLSRDGSHVYIVEVDGRSAASPGITTQKAGELLQSMGAYTGLNLDGGGSSTMLVRASGTTTATVHNVPSDGSERPVANSLVFRSTANAKQLADVRVTTPVTNGDAVFPGTTRTVNGIGIARSGAGVKTDGTFTADGSGTITRTDGTTATLHAGTQSGSLTAVFSAQGKTATKHFSLLGPLDHLAVSEGTIALKNVGESTQLSLTGYDADGRSAAIEPQNVTVTGGTGNVTLTPAADGTYTVTGAKVGADTFTLTAGGHSTQVTVTVGMEDHSVLNFSDAKSWTLGTARATGTISSAEGHNGSDGLRMTYDFTQSTATRGAYAILPKEVPLTGQPLQLRLWVKGDGSGAWPRIQIRTGDGIVTNLDGENITWTGWKQMTFDVPAGTAYPLTLQRIRIMETRSTAQYHGDITLSDLTEVLPPDSKAPVTESVHDASILTNGTVSGRSLRVAVISDAQFTDADTTYNQAIIANLRRSLRQIVAAQPDLIVIDGDLVDEANSSTFALAEKILDQEVTQKTSTPWIWASGNHEVMGSPISLFAQQKGAQLYSTRVLQQTRITTLDSSRGTLHADGIDQLSKLQAQLDRDATDDSITGELVFFHIPTDDYLVDKNSQLSDRNEAAAFDQMLANWREKTGKSVAVINGHVGGFNARSFDGVTQITNGNSGKGPAATATNGGFTGWTMLGINPSAGQTGDSLGDATARTRWLQAETHAHVDASADPVAGGNGVELSVDETTLQVGQHTTASGSFYQDGIGTIPIGWPVSAQWGGDGATIQGSTGTALERVAKVVRYNPDTHELTALAPGTATLSVTVNGVTSTKKITVEAAPNTNDGGGSDAGGTGSSTGQTEGSGTAGQSGGETTGHNTGVVTSGQKSSSVHGTGHRVAQPSTRLPKTGMNSLIPALIGLGVLLVLGGTGLFLLRRRHS